MTIALRTAGTATGATDAVTAVNPAVPTGTTASDISVLIVELKPYNATVTTPTGWTLIGFCTNGSTANAADVGSTRILMYTRIGATVGAIGNLSQSSANTMGAVIHSYSKTGDIWDASMCATGIDSTNAANYSATGATGFTVAAGDWVVTGTAVNADLGTPTSMAIGGMSGATLGTDTNRTNLAVTTGNDSRLLVNDRPISSGSSTAAPTYTYTNASSTSGSTLFLRLREVATAGPSGTLTVGTNSGPNDYHATKTTGSTWNFLEDSPFYVSFGDSGAGTYDWISLNRFFLNVPQGATISDATITMYAHAAMALSGTFTISASDLDDSPMHYTTTELNARTVTTATASWTPAAWTADVTYATVDISAVIQEVVDRPGWVAGNYILIYIEESTTGWGTVNNQRQVRAANFDLTQAPQLTLTWASGADARVRPGIVSNPALSRSYTW